MPIETHNWKGLNIIFSKYPNKEIYYCTVNKGQTRLIFKENNNLENLRSIIRDFLNDGEEIQKVINNNHVKFLKEKNIPNANSIGIFRNTKAHREAYCYICRFELSSFDDYSCIRCKWLLCVCGACGCGFKKSL